MSGKQTDLDLRANGAISRSRRRRSSWCEVAGDTHDVLLAENTPAESFVDDEGRGIFHNAQTFHDLYPDAVKTEAVYCAPRVEDGYALEAIRQRLAARVGTQDHAAAA